MGCAASAPKAEPPPTADAPADWDAKAKALFKLLDKNNTGFISTVADKKKDDVASEFTVLGADVMTAQNKMGDLTTAEKVSMDDFVAKMKANAEKLGTWAPVGAFIDAASAAASAPFELEPMIRNVFKAMDSKWCTPADTGKVAMPKELKEIGGKTDEKVGTILAGLEPETAIDCDAFVAHVLPKVNAPPASASQALASH